MSARVRIAGIGVAFAAMVALATIATAQPPQRRGGPGMSRGGMGDMGGIMLLRSEQVQKELNLTDEQKEKLQALGNKMRGSFSGMRDLNEDQRREKFQEVGKEIRKGVADILQPEQLKRFRQIELQQQGAAALMRPEVGQALNLTQEQKEKLEKIQQDTREKMQSLFQPRAGGERPSEEQRNQAREKMQQVRQEGEEAALGVLTAQQKQTFEEMKGKPFELDRSQMFGRGGDRGGDRGNRGGDRQRGRNRDQ